MAAKRPKAQRQLSAGEQEVALDIHFHIDAHHRTGLIHGASGGITNRGLIQMSLYTERMPIARLSQLSIPKSGGRAHEAITQHEEEGMIRDVLFTGLMTADVAHALGAWLQGHAGKLFDVLAEDSQEEDNLS